MACNVLTSEAIGWLQPARGPGSLAQRVPP